MKSFFYFAGSKFKVTSKKMVKELMTIELERDTLQQKWGFTVQGGADLSLTAKIASVKVGREHFLSNLLFVSEENCVEIVEISIISYLSNLLCFLCQDLMIQIEWKYL